MNRGEKNQHDSALEVRRVKKTVDSEPTPPSVQAIEIAGALQSTLYSLEDRDFSLDIQQEEALQQLGKALVDGKTSGYVEMATSTGKTTIEALVAEAGIKANKRVLMVAPTVNIANQLSGRQRSAPTGLTRFTNLHDDTAIGHHYGKSRAHWSDQLVISTYSGLVNEAKNGSAELGEFDIIIADECHRSLGEKTSSAMKTLFPDAIKFGFSATPDYAIDRKSDEVFGEQIFEYSLIDAIESGKTAPVRALIYETDQKLDLFDSRGDFTERELAPLINNAERNGTAFNLATAFVKDGRQGIIACLPGEFNIHARVMAAMLNDQAGINAAEVGAHLTNEQNALRLRAYQEGTLDVLTFTRSLEEGWDSNKTSFCINMTPTSSPVRTKQLLGRVLRKKPDGGESVYVDFIDTTSGREKLQYTAMHALDLDTVNVDRVLGPSSGHVGSDWIPKKEFSLPQLDAKLLERIFRSNGRLLSEVLVTKQVEKADPLVRHWERILERGGMPAEPLENDVLPANVQKMYKDTFAALVKRDGDQEPSPKEVLEEIYRSQNLSQPIQKALGQYGIRLNASIDDLIEVPETTVSLAESNAIFNETVDALDTVLGNLSEREQGVIRSRYGLDDGKARTLDEVGVAYGVTKHRISQIESKTMAKLRHPSRSEKLEDDFFEASLVKPESPSAEKPTLNTTNTQTYIDSITENFDPNKIDLDVLNDAGINNLDHHDYSKTIQPYATMLSLPEGSLLHPDLKKLADQRISLIRMQITTHRSRKESLASLPINSESQKMQREESLSLLDDKISYLESYIATLSTLLTSVATFKYQVNRQFTW